MPNATQGASRVLKVNSWSSAHLLLAKNVPSGSSNVKTALEKEVLLNEAFLDVKPQFFGTLKEYKCRGKRKRSASPVKAAYPLGGRGDPLGVPPRLPPLGGYERTKRLLLHILFKPHCTSQSVPGMKPDDSTLTGLAELPGMSEALQVGFQLLEG